MATTREEIAIKLGVDSRSAVTALESFNSQMTSIGKDIGKNFTKGVGRIADAFGLMNLITQARNLSKEFVALKEAGDLEEIQKQFGTLTGSELDAMENVGFDLEKFWKKVQVKTLGGAQSVMSVIAEMVNGRKGLSAAMNAVVDADIAKMEEFAAALEATRAEKIWAAERDALLRFKALQDQIAFRRADTEGKIKMLEAKVQELSSLMNAATNPVEQYGLAGQIITAEDSLKDLKKQQYLDQSMRDLQNAHDFMDAQPEARQETEAEYLERGQGKAYKQRGLALDYLAIGQQTAAQRYAAAAGMQGGRQGSPPMPKPIEVIIVGVNPK